MTITLTLEPEEVAGIIHARAGNLCHAVTYPDTESEEESVPELISSLREAVNALEAARINKAEEPPIPPEGEVPVTQAKDEEAIAIDQEAACHSIYALTTELSHLASAHEEGRSLPGDTAKAVGALEELVEAVKTLYGLNDEENEDEAPADCVK